MKTLVTHCRICGDKVTLNGANPKDSEIIVCANPDCFKKMYDQLVSNKDKEEIHLYQDQPS